MTSGGGWQFGKCSECERRAKQVPGTGTWFHEDGDICADLLRAKFIPNEINNEKETHK